MTDQPRLRPLAAAIHSLFDSQSGITVASRTGPARRAPAFLPLGAALACMAFAPDMAFAQAAPQTEATMPEVKVRDSSVDDGYAAGISTIGKTPTPIRDIPQSVTVINRAVMDAQAATSLSDVLRSVPGITIGAAEGGTIGNNINLRGFSARTDLYLDGARDRGQYYRDVFSLDSVEVLKGPSSMLFGRGSTGGVINQVSKQPFLGSHNEASLTAGSQPSLRVTADTNQQLSATSAFRVAVMGQDVHSTRDVMENKDFGFAPSLRTGIGTPTEITLSAFLTHNTDMPDYGLPAVNGRPADVDRHNFYGTTDDRTIQDVGEFTALVKHKLEPGLTLRNQTRFSNYSIDGRASNPNTVGTLVGGVFTPLTATGATPNGNTTNVPLSQLFVQTASKDRKIDDTALYNQTDVISEFRTGSLKHTLLTGLEAGHDYYRNQAYTRSSMPIVSLLNPAYGTTPSNSATTLGNLAEASATSVAPYVNDSVELTKQWKLVGGLRRDRYKAGISNSVTSATTPATASQTVSYTSVRSGLIYQPNTAQSYYLSYGSSFNPSLETLTVTNGQQSLPPEKNSSVEAGAKWDLSGGDLSISTAVFRTEKKNARTQVSTGVFESSGNIQIKGFELGTAGRVTRNWQVFGGYTFLDARIVSALDGTQGNVPVNTPRHSAALWSTYNFTREWEAGGGITYMSNRFANNQNVVSSGNYERVDATLAYHQPKYDIRFNILNLTNRLNYEQLIPSDQGRAVPSIDRTYLLTLTSRF